VKYHDATSGNDIEVTLGTLISTTVDDSSTQPPTTTISDGSATDDFADLLTELQNQNIAAGITAADIKSVEISNDKTKIIVSYGNNNPIDTIELNIVDANGNQSTIDDSLTTTTVGNQTTANDTVTTTTYKKITVTDDANPDKSYTISTLISKVEGDATTANIYSDEKGYSFESLENDLGIENISSVNIIEPANQGGVTKIEVNYNDENGAPATKTFLVDGTDKNGDPNTMDAFTYSTSVRERTKFTIGSKDSPINIDITKMGPMLVQTGANEGQQLAIEIPALNAINLGVNDLSVSTQDEATESIDTISKAINQLSSVRAKIGAYANRLEHTITNLNTTDETMTSAYSRIMDVDIAEEMTEYSTSQVLVQAATSVLSQANERPQQVLQLLQ
jgi:flagellin